MKKMAKASEADMAMAMELVSALDALGHHWVPCMPEPLQDKNKQERFDMYDDQQCGRALRYLLGVTRRGSLSRVIYGMAVLLDPRNKLVDPAADTLEHHPETLEAKRIAQDLGAAQAKTVDDSPTCRARG